MGRYGNVVLVASWIQCRGLSATLNCLQHCPPDQADTKPCRSQCAGTDRAALLPPTCLHKLLPANRTKLALRGVVQVEQVGCAQAHCRCTWREAAQTQQIMVNSGACAGQQVGCAQALPMHIQGEQPQPVKLTIRIGPPASSPQRNPCTLCSNRAIRHSSFQESHLSRQLAHPGSGSATAAGRLGACSARRPPHRTRKCLLLRVLAPAGPLHGQQMFMWQEVCWGEQKA